MFARHSQLLVTVHLVPRHHVQDFIWPWKLFRVSGSHGVRVWKRFVLVQSGLFWALGWAVSVLAIIRHAASFIGVVTVVCR